MIFLIAINIGFVSTYFLPNEHYVPITASPFFATITEINYDKNQVLYTWVWYRPVIETVFEKVKDCQKVVIKEKRIYRLVENRLNGVFDLSEGIILDGTGQRIKGKEVISILKKGMTVIVGIQCYEINPIYLSALKRETIIFCIPNSTKILLNLFSPKAGEIINEEA